MSSLPAFFAFPFLTNICYYLPKALPQVKLKHFLEFRTYLDRDVVVSYNSFDIVQGHLIEEMGTASSQLIAMNNAPLRAAHRFEPKETIAVNVVGGA
ncbi:hypothetical protein BX616_003313, partial [Lobosporangium transversale]